jgi:hypothetical protein
LGSKPSWAATKPTHVSLTPPSYWLEHRSVEIEAAFRLAHIQCWVARAGRHIQDYATIFLGASGFKIARLLIALAFAIHIFACAFYKVVIDHRTPEEVQSFLDAKGAAPDVSCSYQLAHFCDRSLQMTLLIVAATRFCAGPCPGLCEFLIPPSLFWVVLLSRALPFPLFSCPFVSRSCGNRNDAKM